MRRVLLCASSLALAGCVSADEDAEYFGVPAWCEATYGWGDLARIDEQALAEAVNGAREAGAVCGVADLLPAGTVEMAPKLRCAARMHARDMVERGFEGHVDPDGLGPEDRLASAQYAYFSFGELLGESPGDAAAQVETWLAEPASCRVLMDPSARELGVGVYEGRVVLVLATPG